MRCRYRENIYKCGEYLEVDIFPAFHSGGKKIRRRSRYKPTNAMQERLNQRNAEKYLTRILNANFTRGDIELTLTYDDKHLPDEYEQAVKDVNNYLRRVRRLRAKRDLPEMKRVTIPGGGRFHFHIIMSGGVAREELEQLWGKGWANTKRLEPDDNGLAGLAIYISNQLSSEGLDNASIFDSFDIDEQTGEVSEKAGKKHLRNKGERRFTCSANVIKPVPEVKEGRIGRKRAEELATFDSKNAKAFEQIYPGYSFVASAPFYNEENGGYYLHVRMRRRN